MAKRPYHSVIEQLKRMHADAAQPASNHQERCIVHASLPVDMQASLISHHAKRLSENWLESALDDGHFDAASPTSGLDALRKFESTTHFLSNAQTQEAKWDPVLGALDEGVVHVVPVDFLKDPQHQGFAPLLERIVDHVLEQLALAQSTHPPEDASPFHGKALQAMAKAMVACAAMDLPDVVERIARAHPGAMDVCLNVPDCLGDATLDWDTSVFVHRTHADLKPYAMALLMSKPDSMQAMVDAGMDVLVLGKRSMQKEIDGPIDSDPFHALDFFKHSPLMGMPSAYATALVHNKDAQPPLPESHHNMFRDFNLMEPAVKSLKRGEGKNSLHAYQDAFHVAGFFEIKPMNTVEMALFYGNAKEIKRLKGDVDWVAFESRQGKEENHFLMKALNESASNKSFQSLYEDAYLAAIDRCVADGQYENVFATLPVVAHGPVDWFDASRGSQTVVHVQPVARTIQNDLTRVLARMMDLGLDVKNPLHEGADGLMDYAQKNGAQNACNAMRAHLARNAAHALLSDMEGPSAQKRSAP